MEKKENWDWLLHSLLFLKILTVGFFHFCNYMCAKSLSCVWLFAALWTVAYQAHRPWDISGKNTGVGAISFSRASSWPRDWTCISCLLHCRQILNHWAIFPILGFSIQLEGFPRKPKLDLLSNHCCFATFNLGVISHIGWPWDNF